MEIRLTGTHRGETADEPRHGSTRPRRGARLACSRWRRSPTARWPASGQMPDAAAAAGLQRRGRAHDPADTAAAIAQPAFTPDPNSPLHASAQQQMLANINAYFNSFRIMEGRFIQFGPSGEQSEGVFFMTRPGRIRFHYSPPSKLDVVSDGSSVAIRDGRTRTQELYPLSTTPLRYLLADQVDLTSQQASSRRSARSPTWSRSPSSTDDRRRRGQADADLRPQDLSSCASGW